MKIEFASFVGMKPELTDKLIPANFAIEALNVDTNDGSITAWHGLEYVQDLGKVGTLKTLYKMVSGTFLHWTEEVSVARVPIANNTGERLVFTGQDKPRYTDSSLAVAGGGTFYPNISYWLGIPIPAQIIEASVAQNIPDGMQFQYTIAGTEEDSIGGRFSRYYVYTYVTNDDVEGPPSEISSVVYANDTEEITLTNFSSSPTGSYNITKVRIYVSVNGSSFLFLDQVILPVGVYTDSGQSTLGAAIDTTLYSPPLDGLKGVKSMANGFISAYIGNDIYFSEPYQVQGWPEDYRQTIDHNVSGLSASGNMLLLPTDGNPYTGMGNHPSEVILDKLEQTQGNVSFRSLVDINNGVMYASNDGVVWLNDGRAIVVSQNIISEDVWKLIDPTSVHAYFYRDKYFGFYDSGLTGTITADTGEKIPAKGGFILDHARGSVTYTDVYCDTAYSDTRTGELYIVQNIANVNKLYKWNSDTDSPLSARWLSKTIVTPSTTFTAGRVDAKEYPVTYKLYEDNVLKHIATVTDDKTFRLPSGYIGRIWNVEVSGNMIDGFFLANNPSEL